MITAMPRRYSQRWYYYMISGVKNTVILVELKVDGGHVGGNGAAGRDWLKIVLRFRNRDQLC